MNPESVKKYISSFASVLPSISLADNEKSQNTFILDIIKQQIEEVLNLENSEGKKNKKSEKVETWSDSDEEFQLELQNAVKKYRKNKKQTESNTRVEKRTEKNEKPIARDDTTEQKSINKESATDDVRELINYFFQSTNHRNGNRKTSADYEKQGAIPKTKMTCQSKVSGANTKLKKHGKKGKEEVLFVDNKSNSNNKKNSDHELLEMLNSDEVAKADEDTCLKPFFYIIPENPSPHFSLPRGSYYVIPKAPSSLSEKIIFHPEKNDMAEIGGKAPLSSDHNPVNNGCRMNNLSKKAVEKRDSHLNIGPSDVALNDFTNNVETNCGSRKIYKKTFQSDDEKEDVEVTNGAGTPEDRKRSHEIVQSLMSEFPDLNVEFSHSIAEKYLDNERGLEEFISSERLNRKIQSQFERLVLALPESSFSELREKCNEFQGDEELLENYIKEQTRVNEVRQLAINLQSILPDADMNFLIGEVERLHGDTEALSLLAEKLLEENAYPKISDDQTASQRSKLWQSYVTNFNVKNFIRNVPKPEDFEGQSNTADEDLISQFLSSRYANAVSTDFIQMYRLHGRNLTKTCDALSSTYKPIRLAESSFQEENFTEGFLKEVCYIDHKKEINDYMKEVKERKAIEVEIARLNGCFLSCPLCSDDELIASDAVACPEGHVFCEECIRRYFYVKMGDGIFKFICPLEDCETVFTLTILENLLPENVVLKIIQKQQAQEITAAEVDGLESCPFCEFAYIPNPQDKIFYCQNSSCLIETCRKCHEKNHIPLRCEEVERPKDVEARKRIEESMTEKLVRTCPKCQKKIVRADGCNKMMCSCGAMFCYLCRERITGYDHFKGRSYAGKCPLYSDDRYLHGEAVFEAGIQARNQIIQENPDVRVLYDPSNDPHFK